ncbi:MAG TPA: redox-sensing transcriptional repressor Rex [Bacillota bacterium]|nr:MAG: Redox-sensing transcriptional repressor Rex [Firmicutes bacterium ADurb.Bin153]HNV34011.1 redox-sensing transcriptional repressor Rex [Bacillota bacterium]HPU96238.1 redox-sensing transcriptional repressor Rex [Bacillota bacterium]
MNDQKVPDVVVKRLPMYLRALDNLENAGLSIVSSKELGDVTGTSPTQVRKDLTIFGGFGKQGVGYKIATLKKQLLTILKLDQDVKIAIVGLGRMGKAIIHYNAYKRDSAQRNSGYKNLVIEAGFDIDEEVLKQGPFDSVPAYHVNMLKDVIIKSGIKIAVLTVPAEAAQKMADICIEAGVKAFLNFSPATLIVPENVKVSNADVTVSLQSLAFYA